MAGRALRALAAGVVAIAVLGSSASFGAGRFQKASPLVVESGARIPPGLDTTPVTVVVMLAGDPVATAQETAGRRLSRGEKDAVKGMRKSEQKSIEPQIKAAGGKIVGSFQSAINGIKVQIARNKLGALYQIAGVVDVKSVNRYERDNAIGVPRVQAPAVWAGIPGYRGEGIKVAVIDTGIDYTHANFGGPGTTLAFDTAAASSASPANPALFGPGAPKVKGGIDLVGDDYDADNNPVAVPDPNPLDCIDAGHGSHVAGTVAGYGVLPNGSKYTGPYDLSTHNTTFRIGPGVAPRADLYAVRVFGCFGTTDVVVEALDWAVDNDMDVVNMSLGSSYGTSDSADATASDNAVKAGIVVVASAGNSNALKYITSSPASSTRTISVAAATTPAIIPFAAMALPLAGSDPAGTVTGIDANGYVFAGPVAGIVKVLTDGNVLGCSTAAFAGAAGKIAVVQRGSCGRTAKAIYGQQAGAIAVIMVNNSSGLPPYEGPIFQNPDDGAYYDVTIPFIGVTPEDGARLALRDGLSITMTAGAPQLSDLAGFSSGGPRNGDSMLKPDIAGPGTGIVSTFVGSGNLQEALSGTSMASPHVAGVAALVQQAHPKWKPSQVKAAIINSGDPLQIAGYVTRNAGAGMVNAAAAAKTQVTATADDQATSMSFGLEEIDKNYSKQRTIKLHNDGATDATFTVSTMLPQGSPHTVTLSATTVTVKAKKDAEVKVTLNVPVGTAGNSDAFRDVAGLVKFTPLSVAHNNGIGMKVPYYMVPRVMSKVDAKLAAPVKLANPNGIVNLTNKNSPIAATADFYSWGLQGKGKDSTKKNQTINLAAAGVQQWDSPDGQVLVFALTHEEGWSAPSTREFDVYIDLDGDGQADVAVIGIDYGLITTGAFNGQMAAAIAYWNGSFFDIVGVGFLAQASTDGSTILLPVLAADIGLSPANPRFSYTAQVYDLLSNATDAFAKSAKYNAFGSAITDGQYGPIAPNAAIAVPFTVNPTELVLTPALGLMVVTQDNKNGKEEANLVKIEVKP